jgi:hypothetical protein
MIDEFNHEEIAACRRRAEIAVEGAAERPPRSDFDDVRITFDWLPHVEEGRITLQVCVERGSQKSTVDFVVDLSRLSEIERKYLANFLASRHAGVTTPYELAWHLSWLLELSLVQSAPALTSAEWQLKVRQLLLVDDEIRKRESP